MKYLFPCLWVSLFAASCNRQQDKIVSARFIDSLISHYAIPAMAIENSKEMQFWRSRIDPGRPGFVNESRYAGGLAMAFRMFGEIDSLEKADSMLMKADSDLNHREASIDLALMAHSLTRHRFKQADSLLQKAKAIGLRPYESLTSSFDVDFELGRYTTAQIELNSLHASNANDYGYFFRRSKMDHFKGLLDSAIWDMQRAADLAGNNEYLKEVALANAGDLYLHSGDLEEAGQAYMTSIRLNAADFHSIMGLGWIALVHDHDEALAENIFRFVQGRNGLPDPLFRLAQVTDSSLRRKSAMSFAEAAGDKRYGRMYDKYLIQLYTGVLHDPARAEYIAKDELNNRATPQTYAWYAWALFTNGKKMEAYQVFEKEVSGQPLEGLELYWMGKLLQGMNKGYDAREFLKAANAARFDLEPAMQRDIKAALAD